MKALLICIILSLLGVSSTLDNATYQAIDYRLLPKKYHNRPTPYATCDGVSINTIRCFDCTQRGICVDGNSLPIILGTCPSDQICVGDACVKPPLNPPCSPVDGIDFECNAVGTFPDPGNCKKYHMCIPKIGGGGFDAHPINCEGPADEYAYNVRTTLCDRRLTTKTCSGYPIPLCTGLYKSGALAENPAYYYVCLEKQPPQGSTGPKVLYPVQYRCDNGKRFNPTSFSCSP